MKTRKSTRFHMLMACSFFFTCTEAMCNTPVISPMMHILMCDKGVQPSCTLGLSAAGASSQGGPFSYYDISVEVDGASATYLSAMPGHAHGGSNEGYRFSFFPSAEMQYTFNLTASSPMGQKSEVSTFSKPFSLSSDEIKGIGALPIADAGKNQIAQNGTVVQLNGSDSYNGITGSAEGLSYAWEIHSAPQAITLDGADTATPSFTAQQSGNYIFRLQVAATDSKTNTRHSAIRYTQVSVVEDLANALLANPGKIRQIPLGEPISLNGSESLPEESSGALYRWELLNRSELGTSAILQDGDTAKASFTPNKTGTHVFRLTVYDGDDFSFSNLIVSVYDKNRVGHLIEQWLSPECGYSCRAADLNGDTKLSQEDLVIFNTLKGTTSSDSTYLKEADVNRDHLIDGRDEAIYTECLKSGQQG